MRVNIVQKLCMISRCFDVVSISWIIFYIATGSFLFSLSKMAQKFVVIALFVVFVALVQSAPQFDQQFQQQQQQQPDRNAKYAVFDSRYHQDPSGEYNFEWVKNDEKTIESAFAYRNKNFAFKKLHSIVLLDTNSWTAKSSKKMANLKLLAAWMLLWLKVHTQSLKKMVPLRLLIIQLMSMASTQKLVSETGKKLS